MRNRSLYTLVVFACIALYTSTKSFAQGVSYNTTGSPADASAMLDVASTSKGVLVPRMDSTQRATISAPATGLLVFQTNGVTPGFYYYNGTAWISISSLPGSMATGDMLYWNGSTLARIPAGTNGQLLTLNSGVPTWTTTTPTLTTTSVSPTSLAAPVSSGGNINNDGGDAVTARGVCWNTSPSPTVALTTKTTDGTGTGSFTSNITGLTAGTTYYVRAYATNSAGTAYGNELQFNIAVGTSYGGGIIAYILQPGDPGYNASLIHGLIAAPADQGSLQWGCSGTLIGASGTALGTGQANTTLIVSSCGAGTAAYCCDTLTLGGYTDWYLPSYNEIDKMAINKGAIGGFATTWYWSSTEGAAIWANARNFGTGLSWLGDGKSSSVHFRAVRSF